MSLSVAASTQALSAEKAARLLDRVRKAAPRVHCITNAVAQPFTANTLLALGAVPSMTIALDEVAGFAASADALLVNLGTLDDERRQAIPAAIRAAKAAGHPVVLDPVFIDRSPGRADYARDLMGMGLDIIKANEAELNALFDTRDGVDDAISRGAVFAITGAEDKIESQGEDFRLINGHQLLVRVTATGCAAGAVLAAFSALEDDKALAAAAGLSVFNIAGEIAAERCGGPGTLVPELLDALYQLSPQDIERRLKTA
ncbi:hydroxyethylthiazole kinase [Roseibium denhamense]|uniref:Hydroxyethylthiazole kinase n=1 Tax=Roseibium denhamense TaxID=76305 RepID=A0ABY1N8R8_9HYPH|nr:hydroxyethylthiazole kinase [Roseibium denhamense]MTI05643.1 hydroxyethylthiazole kinase [Roseibium denhamense]SMP03461.1 hydroxyethylthiazole kinase [Roseibium denhamense]